MASIQQILQPITFTKVVSRISAASSQFLNFFGMQPGGPNERNYGHGRTGSYKVFNNVRTVALGTAPGSPAAKRSRNPVGEVPFVYPRMHQQLSLLYEEIHNFSKIDDPKMRDIAGESYIRRQMLKPVQEATNWRTALLVGMLRDSLYFHELGQNWYPSYDSSNALLQVSFDMPAGNKDQLNIVDGNGTSINGGDIIDVPWDSTGADIPYQIQLVDAALFRRCGLHLKTIVVRSQQWNNITNNDYVTVGAGIANPPFQVFERQTGVNPDGSPFMVKMGRLTKCPGIDFMINDEGIDIGNPNSATWQYHIGEDNALFLPDVNGPDVFEGCIASEPIAEYDNGPISVKTGQAAWTTTKSNPTTYEAFILDNFFPVPYNPGSWCYATVSGF